VSTEFRWPLRLAASAMAALAVVTLSAALLAPHRSRANWVWERQDIGTARVATLVGGTPMVVVVGLAGVAWCPGRTVEPIGPGRRGGVHCARSRLGLVAHPFRNVASRLPSGHAVAVPNDAAGSSAASARQLSLWSGMTFRGTSTPSPHAAPSGHRPTPIGACDRGRFTSAANVAPRAVRRGQERADSCTSVSRVTPCPRWTACTRSRRPRGPPRDLPLIREPPGRPRRCRPRYFSPSRRPRSHAHSRVRLAGPARWRDRVRARTKCRHLGQLVSALEVLGHDRGVEQRCR
jgi:hypothetical protein